MRCFIAAYNLKDGSPVWKAYSTGSDQDALINPKTFNQANPQYSAMSMYQDVNGGNKQGGSFKRLNLEQLQYPVDNLGIKTWLKPQQEKDGWQKGGGAVNGYIAYDQKTNLIYYGTGNPGVWNPDVRPGDNKWSNAIFARDVDTGEARWAMQTTPHDEWDYDATNEVILHQGKHPQTNNPITLATQVNKNGFIYTWQADNGTLVAANKIQPFVNWAKDVDLRTGVPDKLATASTHQDYNAKGICPSVMGVKNVASPAAYSPNTNLLYVPLNLTCMSYKTAHTEYVAGEPWAGATLSISTLNLPNNPTTNMELISAINLSTQQTIWSHSERFPIHSGVLAFGNQIAYGTLDRWLKVLDERTGEELWKFQINSGVVGNPFTYQHKGKQYIGVMGGSGGWADVARILATCPPREYK